MFDYHRELHIDETMMEGGLAVVRCHSTGSLRLLATDRVIQADAREIFTLQKIDGRWFIRFYMNNFPMPASLGK